MPKISELRVSNPDQYAFRLYDLPHNGELPRIIAEDLTADGILSSPCPIRDFDVPYAATISIAVSSLGARCGNDPRLYPPEWDYRIPQSHLLHDTLGRNISVPFMASNEPVSCLTNKDTPKKVIGLGGDVSEAFDILPGKDGYIGFGGTAALDWAGMSSHAVFVDVDPDVVKFSYYVLRPMVMLADTGQEFLEFISGVQQSNKKYTTFEKEREKLGLYFSLLNYQTKGDIIPDNFRKEFYIERDRKEALRDTVILRAVERNLPEKEIQFLYRYCTSAYGLESVLDYAPPFKTSSFHRVRSATVNDAWCEVVLDFIERYWEDKDKLTITTNKKLFQVAKTRFIEDRARYAIDDATDMELYESVKRYFDNVNVPCRMIYTSNIGMGFKHNPGRLVDPIRNVYRYGPPPLHVGFWDSGSKDFKAIMLDE